MAQENVEIVRPSIEAWVTGDSTAVVKLCHPGVIMMGPGDWANETPTIGQREVALFFKILRSGVDPDSAQAISLVDAGGRVLARLSVRDRGGRSESWTCVFTLEEGKISLIERYADHARALKAVGLSEQDAQADS